MSDQEFYFNLGSKLIAHLATSLGLDESLEEMDKPDDLCGIREHYIYQRLSMNNGIDVDFRSWSKGNKPFYIVLLKNHNYKFELDLSMIVCSGKTYTWHLREPSHDLNKLMLSKWLGERHILDNEYRDRVSAVKISLAMGATTPRTGYAFIDHLNWNDTCNKFSELMRKAIEIHSDVNLEYEQNLIGSAPTSEGLVMSGVPETYTEPTTKMEFILVKGGRFLMGGTVSSDGHPRHWVIVNDFYIAKYPITQGQWKALMDGKNPSHFKEGDNYPVESITWNDANDYISRLNKLGHGAYRLPTEAEYEYAASSGNKAGAKPELYAGGRLNDVGWYSKNSESSTHPVGKKKPNRLGLYDMSGNVWVWCQDWHDSDFCPTTIRKHDLNPSAYYQNSPKDNPKGPDTGKCRVIRGGGWGEPAEFCRIKTRFSWNPNKTDTDLGARLVMLLPYANGDASQPEANDNDFSSGTKDEIVLEDRNADSYKEVQAAMRMPTHELTAMLAKSPRKPTTQEISVYNRSPYVKAVVLLRAEGRCEGCKKPAPFNRKSDNTPYLEVHHIIQLANDGEDTVENAIALCPNCHRKAHYG